jgi:general secretion pathway protein J
MKTQPRGFTLMEVVIALAIVAVLLAVMFGGLRVAVGAWRQTDARADDLQHVRSLNQLLIRVVGGTHPYRVAAPGSATQLVFEGEPDRVAFVTATPPVPFGPPIAFAAVTITRDASGLLISQKPLPARDPFERLTSGLTDPTVANVRLRYLRPARDGQPGGGTWEDHWDGARERTLPSAIEITLVWSEGTRRDEPEHAVIALRVTEP